jgi:hypothetical protein
VKVATHYLQSKDWWTADEKPGGRKRTSVVLNVSSSGSEKAGLATGTGQRKEVDEVVSNNKAFEALQADEEGDKQLMVYRKEEAIRLGKTNKYIPLQ